MTRRHPDTASPVTLDEGENAPVSVEPLGTDAFADVYPLLAGHDPRLGRDDWRALFDYHWHGAGEFRGYGLLAGGRVVGFCGAIRAQRTIDGLQHTFCNTTSWIVDHAYRARSLALVAPILAEADLTITDLTPSPLVVRWLERWKFALLESAVIVLPPHRLRGLVSRERAHAVRDEAGIERMLEGEEARVAADHRDAAHCGQVVVENGQGRSLVIYSPIRSAARGYAQVHYVGNPAVFVQTAPAIGRELARAGHGASLVVDERLLRGHALPGSHRVPLRIPRYYRSTSLRPDQVDNLYTELALLGIRTVDGRLLSPIAQRLNAARSAGLLRPWGKNRR